MVVIARTLPRRKGAWLEIWAHGETDSIKLPVAEVPAGIWAGARLEESQWAEIRAAAEYHQLYDKALRILGRREHFEEELRRKLYERVRDPALIRRVLEQCRSHGYLNDTRAAEYVASQLVQRGGIGRMKLRSELLQRGCPRELIDPIIESVAAHLDEAAAARELLDKRRSQFAAKLARMRRKREEQPDFNPRKARMLLRPQLGANIGGFLAARGFSGDEVHNAARRLVDELMEEEFGGD